MIRRRAFLLACLAATAACAPSTPPAPGIATELADAPAPPKAVAAATESAQMDFQIEIVDGKPVRAGALLAVVGITRGLQRTPSCTGTLVAPNLVLTAAHCVCDGIASNVFVGTDPGATQGPAAGLYYRVTAHREGLVCGSGDARTGMDLAVLKLNADVRDVAPIRLAPDSLIARARSYRVVGFGTIDRDGVVMATSKQEAAVPVINRDCRGGVPEASTRFGCQPGRETVAGERHTPDTCSGDSGGPLLVAADGSAGVASSNAFLLAGVTSRSVTPAPRACGYGGIYERTDSEAARWITRAMAELS